MPHRGAESLAVYVRHRVFRKVMRGYDPGEVEAHLETIANMIMTGSFRELVREEEERIAEREAAAAATEAHARKVLEEAEHELKAARMEAEATLQGAQAKAEADERAGRALLEQSKLEADAHEIVEAARAEADQIVAQAQKQAEGIITDAHREGVERVEQEMAQRRSGAEHALEEYVSRRKREADRLVEAARVRAARISSGQPDSGLDPDAGPSDAA